MFDLVPFVFKEEEARIKAEISVKHLSVIFDGTSRLGQALVIIVVLSMKSGCWTSA